MVALFGAVNARRTGRGAVGWRRARHGLSEGASVPFRAVTSQGTVLLCFPPFDETFETVVLRTYGDLPARAPAALEAALSGIYPHVSVRPRGELASLGTADDVWYVYRDGRYSPFVEGEPWWRDESLPRLVIADDGRYMDGNDAALELMGVSREELLRSRSGDFAASQYSRVVPWVWELLRRTGELHSTSVLRRRDGEERALEFHLTRDGAGPGLHLSVMREIPRSAI
jgi:PAS domain S-box-containing protein